MKTPWVGGSRFLLAVLPAVAFSPLAHADELAPRAATTPAGPAPTELAMVSAPPPSPPPATVTAASQPAPAAETEQPTRSHLGVDAVLGGGFLNYVGASARLESRPSARTSFLGRIGYYRGSVIDDDSLRGLSFGVGYRGFFGRGYVGVEGALVAISEKTNGRGEWNDWEAIPNLTSSVGAKLGSIDASVQIMYPLMSLGVNVGVDFATF